MKTIAKMLALPVILVSILTMTSCTKDQLLPIVQDQDFGAEEIDLKQPKPGMYSIFKFTDSGDDQTSMFTGYVFEFQATGGLVVTNAGGEVFNGSWDLNTAETVMTINITGNAALDNLDDDNWTVVRITNQTIKIKANGPDVVVWKRI